MSARDVLAIMRRHTSASVRDIPALKALLHELVELNQTPVASRQAFDAAMHIETAPGGKQKKPIAVDTRVPMKLWPAVFPWEVCRGLSHTPAATLRPPGVPAKPGADSAKLVAPDAGPLNPGMLFVQPVVDYHNPASFWSGGITAGLDVAFLQPFKEASFVSRMAKLLKPEERLPTKFHVGDVGQLVPFSNPDGPHQVTSSVTAVTMVLETRHGWFQDIMQGLAEERTDGMVEKLPGVKMTVEVSDDMSAEMSERGDLWSRYGQGIAIHVEEAIKQCNVAVDPDGVSGGPGETQSFEGTNPNPGKARPSAKTDSKFPKTSAEIAALPPMDYELVALGYRLGLGMPAIARSSNRMIAEIGGKGARAADGSFVVSDESLRTMHKLVSDPSIGIYPPELAMAVNEAASARFEPSK